MRPELTTTRRSTPRAASVPRQPIIPLPDAPIEYPLPEEPETAPEEQPREPAVPVGPETVPAEPQPALPTP